MAYLWLIWLAVLVALAADMILRYRRRELSGGKFALWVVLVIALPFVGVAAYAVVRVVTLSRRDVSPG